MIFTTCNTRIYNYFQLHPLVAIQDLELFFHIHTVLFEHAVITNNNNNNKQTNTSTSTEHTGNSSMNYLFFMVI